MSDLRRVAFAWSSPSWSGACVIYNQRTLVGSRNAKELRSVVEMVRTYDATDFDKEMKELEEERQSIKLLLQQGR